VRIFFIEKKILRSLRQLTLGPHWSGLSVFGH
jgi:hypothetical protein